MGEKSCMRGVKLTKDCPRGSNWREKLSEGGKIGQNCLGSQEKNMSEGVKIQFCV